MNSQKFKQIVEFIVEDIKNNNVTIDPDILTSQDYLRFIRNKFWMWEDDWEPVLFEGIDFSPEHPDNLSKLAFDTAVSIFKYRLY